MGEGKRRGKTAKEIISNAVEEEIAQYPVKTFSPEELEAMAVKRTRIQRKHRLRIAGAAALFLLVLAGAAMVFNNLTVDVGADKNSKEEIVTEDGVVIEDGGWGSGDDILVIQDWDDIKSVEQDIERLLIPEYIPASYRFKEMTVEALEGENAMCIFFFLDNKEREIEIHEFIHSDNLKYFEVSGNYRAVESSKGVVYLQEVDGIKIATIQMGDGVIIDIRGELSDEEVLNIVENLS